MKVSWNVEVDSKENKEFLNQSKVSWLLSKDKQFIYDVLEKRGWDVGPFSYSRPCSLRWEKRDHLLTF